MHMHIHVHEHEHESRYNDDPVNPQKAMVHGVNISPIALLVAIGSFSSAFFT